MATEAFTIRAETDIVHKLDSLAWSLDRSRNYLVNQAIKAYLQANAPACDKINQGIAAADRESTPSKKAEKTPPLPTLLAFTPMPNRTTMILKNRMKPP